MNQQLIETLDIAAADAGEYGQKVKNALILAYHAAQDGDANALEDALAEAKLEDFHFRGIMANVRDALSSPDAKELSKEETRELIEALGKGSPDGFSEADAEKVVEWAREVRVSQALLTMLITHRLTVRIGPDGDVLMAAPKPEEKESRHE